MVEGLFFYSSQRSFLCYLPPPLLKLVHALVNDEGMD
jgi:hypothetical protein